MRKYGIWFNIMALCMVFCLSAAVSQPIYAQADDGIELYKAGEYEKAESKLKETLKNEPLNTTARYYLGLSLMYQGNFTQALEELKTAKNEQEKASQRSLPAVPNAYEIDLALAQAYIGLEQYEEAWPKLESARIKDPGSSDVFLYRGVYYYKQKDFAKAIEALDKSISLDPKKAYAYYYIGMAYSETEDVQKMLEAFKMFLQLAPDAPEAPDVKRKYDAAC
ncbi:MAG: tetratricopeptide repeat protein [Acidobacteria bacterium]|nr:tetratricopeptide repeat protein [Acidobacteriota bacterium]